MKTLRILKATACGGRQVLPDEIVDASDQDAALLIACGKAELCEWPKRSPINRQVSPFELEHRDG